MINKMIETTTYIIFNSIVFSSQWQKLILIKSASNLVTPGTRLACEENALFLKISIPHPPSGNSNFTSYFPFICKAPKNNSLNGTITSVTTFNGNLKRSLKITNECTETGCKEVFSWVTHSRDFDIKLKKSSRLSNSALVSPKYRLKN